MRTNLHQTIALLAIAVSAFQAGRAWAIEIDRPITLKPNGYFGCADGSAFVPLGGFYANWPGKDNGPGNKILPPRQVMPDMGKPYLYPYSQETLADMRGWFAYLKSQGVTAQRMMLRSTDIVGRVEPEKLKAVLDCLDLARAYGLKFQIVLFDDYNKPPYVNKSMLDDAISHYKPDELEKLPDYRKRFLVEKRLASSKFIDPDALKCQKDYLNELIPVLAKRPEVFAYEIENEQDPNSTDWVARIVAHIKSIDPVTAVVGNPVALDGPTLYAWSRTGLDALNIHPYNHGDKRNGSNVYNAARAKQACACLPSYNGESAINLSTHSHVPEWEAAQNARDNIWPTIAAGAIGCMMWVPEYRGEVEEFAMASRVLRELDLSGFKRDRADIRVWQSTAPEEEKDLHDVLRWTGFCMRTGYDLDLVIGSDSGSEAIPVSKVPTPADFSSAWRPFEVTSGYYAQPLTGNGRSKGLIYLANIAGGIKMGSDKQWLRAKLPTTLALRSRLGPGVFRFSVYDLDTHTRTDRTQPGDGSISLGKTAHDYVVTFKSMPDFLSVNTPRQGRRILASGKDGSGSRPGASPAQQHDLPAHRRGDLHHNVRRPS